MYYTITCNSLLISLVPGSSCRFISFVLHFYPMHACARIMPTISSEIAHKTRLYLTSLWSLYKIIIIIKILFSMYNKWIHCNIINYYIIGKDYKNSMCSVHINISK